MTDNPSSVPSNVLNIIPRRLLRSGLGGLDHELGYNEHVLGISSAGPYPGTIMNHANAFPSARYSSTMPVGYNDPPHLTTGPGGHQEIEVNANLMVTLLRDDAAYSICPGPPRSSTTLLRLLCLWCISADQFAPVVLVRVLPLSSPTYSLPYGASVYRGCPTMVPLATYFLSQRSRAFSGEPQHWTSVNSGMSVAEDIEDLASRCLHNPGSHVDKLRMKRSRSGDVKVLIQLEIDDTM
ncbi:hypothetical protein BGY98DRAFT_1128963 [Russula aff. rugulosa BPL654]|nr:hypothetical protein BGY98DRAFT_1128963 [Russula aff. rugulosa BPL654]